MSRKYHIAYYYISLENAEKVEAFRQASGDTEKGLITQYVRGWLGRNREYYLTLAKLDAEKRGLTLPKWAELIVGAGVDGLPGYKQEIANIPGNPLGSVVLGSNLIQKPISYITLTTQNIALLRIGVHYDRDNAVGFLSRIVQEHLDRNWDTLYASQVAAENFENWEKM